MAILVCANCRSENAEDARFCKKCGKRVADDFIDPDVEQRLYERIETRLKDKWIAKDVVEKDMALNAATRLSEWTKLFAFAVGVPGAIAVGILAFLGIKGTIDLSTIEAKTDALKTTASTLEAGYKPLKDKLPELVEIAATLDKLGNRVSSLESEVAKFAPTSALSRSTRVALLDTLKDYSNYLKKLGLKLPNPAPTIYVDEKLPRDGQGSGLWWDGNIYVTPDHANRAKVIHEFNNGVLLDAPPIDTLWSYSAIEAGVANYLTADFLDSPLLDDGVDLTKRVPIAGMPTEYWAAQNVGGMAWGSYLWALREHYTSEKASEKATPAIVRAFKSLKPNTTPTRNFEVDFLKQLVEAGLDQATVSRLFSP